MQLSWFDSIFSFCFPRSDWNRGWSWKGGFISKGGLQCMLMWREHDVNQSSIVVPTNPLTLPPPHGHMLAGMTPAVSIALFPLSLYSFLVFIRAKSNHVYPSASCSVLWLMSLIWSAYILKDFLYTSLSFALHLCPYLFAVSPSLGFSPVIVYACLLW